MSIRKVNTDTTIKRGVKNEKEVMESLAGIFSPKYSNKYIALYFGSVFPG